MTESGTIMPGIDSIEYVFGLFPGLQNVRICGPESGRQIDPPTGIGSPQFI